MPKKLNTSSNQRVDLDDFIRASNEYTAETIEFHRNRLWQAAKAVVAEGFRIEIADQTASPGEFTIYNGVALNKDGTVLNSEAQDNDSRTYTLSGTNLSFYIEIEFVESTSDVDNRAFWDPTFSGNDPNGKEFDLNAATRITPDWQLVTPVSTTTFDVDVDINTVKIPVAFLQTNGANEITGVTVSAPSSNVAVDTLITSSSIELIDTTIFPDTGTILFPSTAESIAYTNNDRANNILTLSIPTANAYAGGVIVQLDGVVPDMLVESTAAVPTAGSDRRRFFFKGDENRGAALAASKETVGDRDDLDLQSLKDHVDFLSAQIREMKWGNLRSDVSGVTVPPLAFTDTRYYDAAGSIQGAKQSLMTIGDGTYTYGDLNSTSDDLGTILQQAHDVMDPTNGGSVYVKAGDYVFDASVTTNRPFRVEFDHGANFVAGTYAAYAFFIGSSAPVEIVGMPGTSDPEDSLQIADFVGFEVHLTLRNCNMGGLTYGLSTTGSTLLAENCIFNATANTDACFHNNAGFTTPLVYRDCQFRYVDTSSDGNRTLANNTSGVHFFDCIFDISYAAAFSSPKFTSWNGTGPDLVDSKFDGCKFISTNTGKAVAPLDFGSTASGVGIDGLHFKDCYFDFTFGTTTLAAEHTVLDIRQTTGSTVWYRDIVIEGCNFAPMADQTIAGASAAEPYKGIALQTSAALNNCRITGCFFGEEPTTASGVGKENHYTRHIELVQQVSADAGDVLRVNDNYFATYNDAVFIDEASANVVNNTFWYNYTASVTLGQVRAIWANNLTSRQHLVVTGNNIDQVISSILTLHNIGIYLSSFDGGNASITGNYIECQNVAQTTTQADAYGVRFVTTNPAFITVSGNTAKTVTQAGFNACIYVSSSASNGESSVISVTGNSCEADSNSNVHVPSVHGILVANGGSNPDDEQPSAISGNSILVGNRAAADSTALGNYYGIKLVGSSMSCTANSIVVIKRVAWGIHTIGQQYTISSNTIKMLDGLSPSGFAQTGIFLDGSSIVTSYINISSNTIYGEGMMKWGIEANGFSGIFMQGINVTGNKIRFSCNVLTPNGGVRLRTAGFGGGSPPDQGGWNISGNTLVEGPDNTGGSPREGIEVIGNGGPSYTGNVVVNSNNIFGEDSYASRTGRAIYVEGFDNVVVSGNGIRRFTSAVTSEIEINGCSTVTVTSNTMEQNQISANLIRFTTSTLSVYDNNVAIPTVAGTHCLGTAATASSGLGNMFANTGILS